MKNDLKLKKTSGIVAGISLCLFLLLFTLFTPQAFALNTISTSLDVGSRGADVTTVQTFLAQDASIYPSGLVTGYYGSLTRSAVTRFQTRYGISAIGRVGPQTRAKINELIVNGGFSSGGGNTSTSKAPYIYAGVTSLSTPSGSTGGLASSTVALSWQTDESARGKVFYGTSPFSLTESMNSTTEPSIGGASIIMTDDTYTTSKTVYLNNLWPTGSSPSSYYYMIEAIDVNGNVSVTWPRVFNSQGVSSQ